MTIYEEVNNEKLTKQIQACVSEQFTGQLDIEATSMKHWWSLHFHQGCLTGCASSMHPIRSWNRQVSVYCPQLPTQAIGQRANRPMYWDYDCLTVLVKQKKIRQEEIRLIVAGQMIEILFDIAQYSEQLYLNLKLQLTYKRVAGDTTEATNSKLVLIPAMYPCFQAVQAWSAWKQAGLTDYSPNLAPMVVQARELRKHTSAIAYQNLTSLADGNWTLRDLAFKLKQNLLPLTQSIMPYVQKGLIKLIEVKDFTNTFQPVITTPEQLVSTTNPTNFVPPAPISPLIACIDDNYNDNLILEGILTSVGYRFISIEEPVKALLVLLESKPDLIFLDVVMPLANGYEICGQIRRVSTFKDTPVIMLTNNNRIVDRVQAKVVGSSGFLSKPIDKDLLLKVIHKHLGVTRNYKL